MKMRTVLATSALFFATLTSLGAALAEDATPKSRATFETATLRGRVVWQAEALKRRFAVETDPDAAKSVIALEAVDGSILPIIKDFRGRGFHLDPKLHEMEWELLVRRFPGTGAAQVVRTYVWRDGKKYEFDYWCDICAIPMYELKECECCQGPIRFRFREATD